ncbi:sestrin-1-like isoform X3 [Ptychodera flava]|uniref:sestrin-1-like isoform X3 n=1 Tax=Ptychodera flava TaxID=63121 RepID=UPI00396A3CC9
MRLCEFHERKEIEPIDPMSLVSVIMGSLCQERGIRVPRRLICGPSAFVPLHKVVQSDTDDEEQSRMFIDVFLQTSRLDHVTQVMGYHPEYVEHFVRTQSYMLRGDGPLPYEYRHYIAIMAAARHRCVYIVRLQETEFLLQGGDPEWLKGLNHIPQKLRHLNDLNKKLAHRPWLVTKDDIEKLLRGADNWSVSELVHAIALLSHFHSLCSFVYGCGINPEVDMEGGHTIRPPSVTETADAKETNCQNSADANHVHLDLESPEGGVEELMQKMKKLEESEAEEPTQEEMVKRFERVEKQSVELLPESEEHVNHLKADLSKYLDDPEFTYQDFAKRGLTGTIPTFRVQDYSWEDHGFSLMNRLYSEIGTLLDDKFRVAYDLTYNTMGMQVNVDTSSLRRAIWNYIHCMFGIRHDDYDYGEVNHLLERSLKAYIKTVACYPERCTKKDFDGFWRGFKLSEKVHVNLMVLDARMQAELLYALRAVMKYMT